MWAAIACGQIRDAEVLVFEENWDAVRAVLSCGTQLRYHPMGGIIGFDYPGLEAVMRMMDIKSLETFHRVQILESAIVSFFAERERAERSRIEKRRG